jgi:hypothetical protein
MNEGRRRFLKSLPLVGGLPLAAIALTGDLNKAAEKEPDKILLINPAIINMEDLLHSGPVHGAWRRKMGLPPGAPLPIVRIKRHCWHNMLLEEGGIKVIDL